jgi:hypothetical protein
MNKTFVRRAAASLLLGCGAVSSMAAVWSTSGWAGAVDDNSLDLYYTSSSALAIKSTAPDPSTVYAFYNLPQLAGFSGNKMLRWVVRYREDAGARVLLTLRRFDIETGVATTVDTFDSDDYGDTVGSPRTDERCAVAEAWDFNQGAYTVQASLTRPNDANLVLLYGFSLEAVNACP